jgi:hypothetical protein
MKRKNKLEPETKKENNTRETRDWCKGRKGVVHVWVWKDYRRRWVDAEKLIDREKKVCQECGKDGLEQREKFYSPAFLIRYFRERAELTQNGLAIVSGHRMDTARVATLESGMIEARISDLCNVATALGLDLTVSLGDVPIERHRSLYPRSKGVSIGHYDSSKK